MHQWNVGAVTITRIEELSGPLFDPAQFFPDFSPDYVEKHRAWLCPRHLDEKRNRLIASMHSYLIETAHHKILIDSCIGNDKDRMPYRDWHRMKTPYLDNFKRTGISPEDIDFVLCTHLHVDHVGWNTRLENGAWVPTFPNARYIFSRTEFAFWQAERNRESADDFARVNHNTFDDSVLPIMHLAELIDLQSGGAPHELIADMILIDAAPGHTPGSITIQVDSASRQALFTGDILHHPLQVYEPHWNSAFCEMPEAARTTRKRILAHCAANDSLMMPAHFGAPFCGRVRENSGAFTFEFDD